MPNKHRTIGGDLNAARNCSGSGGESADFSIEAMNNTTLSNNLEFGQATGFSRDLGFPGGVGFSDGATVFATDVDYDGPSGATSFFCESELLADVTSKFSNPSWRASTLEFCAEEPELRRGVADYGAADEADYGGGTRGCWDSLEIGTGESAASLDRETSLNDLPEAELLRNERLTRPLSKSNTLTLNRLRNRLVFFSPRSTSVVIQPPSAVRLRSHCESSNVSAVTRSIGYMGSLSLLSPRGGGAASGTGGGSPLAGVRGKESARRGDVGVKKMVYAEDCRSFLVDHAYCSPGKPHPSDPISKRIRVMSGHPIASKPFKLEPGLESKQIKLECGRRCAVASLNNEHQKKIQKLVEAKRKYTRRVFTHATSETGLPRKAVSSCEVTPLEQVSLNAITTKRGVGRPRRQNLHQSKAVCLPASPKLQNNSSGFKLAIENRHRKPFARHHRVSNRSTDAGLKAGRKSKVSSEGVVRVDCARREIRMPGRYLNDYVCNGSITIVRNHGKSVSNDKRLIDNKRCMDEKAMVARFKAKVLENKSSSSLGLHTKPFSAKYETKRTDRNPSSCHTAIGSDNSPRSTQCVSKLDNSQGQGPYSYSLKRKLLLGNGAEGKDFPIRRRGMVTRNTPWSERFAPLLTSVEPPQKMVESEGIASRDCSLEALNVASRFVAGPDICDLGIKNPTDEVDTSETESGFSGAFPPDDISDDLEFPDAGFGDVEDDFGVAAGKACVVMINSLGEQELEKELNLLEARLCAAEGFQAVAISNDELGVGEDEEMNWMAGESVHRSYLAGEWMDVGSSNELFSQKPMPIDCDESLKASFGRTELPFSYVPCSQVLHSEERLLLSDVKDPDFAECDKITFSEARHQTCGTSFARCGTSKSVAESTNFKVEASVTTVSQTSSFSSLSQRLLFDAQLQLPPSPAISQHSDPSDLMMPGVSDAQHSPILPSPTSPFFFESVSSSIDAMAGLSEMSYRGALCLAVDSEAISSAVGREVMFSPGDRKSLFMSLPNRFGSQRIPATVAVDPFGQSSQTSLLSELVNLEEDLRDVALLGIVDVTRFLVGELAGVDDMEFPTSSLGDAKFPVADCGTGDVEFPLANCGSSNTEFPGMICGSSCAEFPETICGSSDVEFPSTAASDGEIVRAVADTISERSPKDPSVEFSRELSELFPNEVSSGLLNEVYSGFPNEVCDLFPKAMEHRVKGDRLCVNVGTENGLSLSDPLANEQGAPIERANQTSPSDRLKKSSSRIPPDSSDKSHKSAQNASKHELRNLRSERAAAAKKKESGFEALPDDNPSDYVRMDAEDAAVVCDGIKGGSYAGCTRSCANDSKHQGGKAGKKSACLSRTTDFGRSGNDLKGASNFSKSLFSSADEGIGRRSLRSSQKRIGRVLRSSGAGSRNSGAVGKGVVMSSNCQTNMKMSEKKTSKSSRTVNSK